MDNLSYTASRAAFELDELFLGRSKDTTNVKEVIVFFEDMTWTEYRRKEREGSAIPDMDDWFYKGPDWVVDPSKYLMVSALMKGKWKNTEIKLVSDLVENVNTVVATLKGAIAADASKETQAVMRSFCCDVSRFASAHFRPRRRGCWGF